MSSVQRPATANLDAYWGVDSAVASNAKVGVKGHPTLFQHILDLTNTMPDFWGRYIGGHFALKPAEADFLFDQSGGACRILVIYNGATNSKHSVGGDFAAGVRDGNKAIAAATAIGVPAGVWIYADIEPGWKCTAAWFLGWWDAMFKSQYGGMGGVYENPLAWNAANFATPYHKALKGDSPFIFQDPPAKARYLYSQQGNKGAVKPANITFPFHPAEPKGCTGMTVLWQYAIDCFKPPGAKWGLVDMDLADDRGYAGMWSSGQGQGTLV